MAYGTDDQRRAACDEGSHGSGEFAYALAEKGLIDGYEVYLNPLVWGEGTPTCSVTGEPSGWSSTT